MRTSSIAAKFETAWRNCLESRTARTVEIGWKVGPTERKQMKHIANRERGED